VVVYCENSSKSRIPLKAEQLLASEGQLHGVSEIDCKDGN
jgi:hypothetical protein